ncbi:MAG: hypothetical protein KF901_07325 [Myxococcales bacterium]|nr:hypothetical protein [Myxococcales bacterium]
MARLLRLLPVILLFACGADRESSAGSHSSGVSSAVAPVAPVALAPETPDPVYSPFLIEVVEAPFALISFKDVGMSLPAGERALIYESLAEELALALRGDAAPMMSQVRHDASVADPASHVICEARHIYVDLWSEADGWGYSLWSGCGEDDQFAHRAVRVDRTDRLASLDPLASDIASSLRGAMQTGCFTRLC